MTKLNILVLCDGNPYFQQELEEMSKGSQIYFVFASSFEEARAKVGTIGSDIRILLLPMFLNGYDARWFARALKETFKKRCVIALFEREEFEKEFEREVFAAWQNTPFQIMRGLKNLLGLY